MADSLQSDEVAGIVVSVRCQGCNGIGSKLTYRCEACKGRGVVRSDISVKALKDLLARGDI